MGDLPWMNLVPYRSFSCFFTRKMICKALIPFIGVRVSRGVIFKKILQEERLNNEKPDY
jgi:hypothetical protein